MKQIKYSRQREALLGLLHSTHSHPTADWIYKKMREIFPNISLGTVYRNLNFLSERGDILKLNLGRNSEHFDGNTHAHSHLICKSCGTIMDINDINMNNIYQTIEQQLGTKIDNHSLFFEGLCPDCNKNNKNLGGNDYEICM